MKTVIRLIFCVVLLSGWSLAAISLHVIRTRSAFVVIPKSSLGIEDTWVDTRAWKAEEVGHHRALIEKLVSIGRADVLADVIGQTDLSKADAQLRRIVEQSSAYDRTLGDRVVEMLSYGGDGNPLPAKVAGGVIEFQAPPN